MEKSSPDKNGFMQCPCGNPPTHWQINVEKDYIECVDCGRQFKSTCIITATPVPTSVPKPA